MFAQGVCLGPGLEVMGVPEGSGKLHIWTPRIPNPTPKPGIGGESDRGYTPTLGLHGPVWAPPNRSASFQFKKINLAGLEPTLNPRGGGYTPAPNATERFETPSTRCDPSQTHTSTPRPSTFPTPAGSWKTWGSRRGAYRLCVILITLQAIA